MWCRVFRRVFTDVSKALLFFETSANTGATTHHHIPKTQTLRSLPVRTSNLIYSFFFKYSLSWKPIIQPICRNVQSHLIVPAFSNCQLHTEGVKPLKILFRSQYEYIKVMHLLSLDFCSVIKLIYVKVQVKFTLEQTTKTQRGSRGISLLFL